MFVSNGMRPNSCQRLAFLKKGNKQCASEIIFWRFFKILDSILFVSVSQYTSYYVQERYNRVTPIWFYSYVKLVNFAQHLYVHAFGAPSSKGEMETFLVPV